MEWLNRVSELDPTSVFAIIFAIVGSVSMLVIFIILYVVIGNDLFKADSYDRPEPPPRR